MAERSMDPELRSLLEHHMRPVPSTYFEPHDLTLAAHEIVLVACMRNEIERLPFFLEYYRRLGVHRFLLVDNDSADGTSAYLAQQDDVEYFWTDTSYRGSSSGRLWLQELADTYATDHWVLTVDVDELLVFPGSELLSVGELCAYLDDHDQDGLFTVLLDMYSDRPLGHTRYEPGSDFIETCPYFETDTYVIMPGSSPPFIGVFGGPRDRLFRANGESGRRPMMKKIPLVRWRNGFSYMFSTHSHRYVPLSDTTGALLHFKFVDTFEKVAQLDAVRGDRRQSTHYRVYQEQVERDVCFYGTQSRRYRGPSDLVRLGVMSVPQAYQTFVSAHLRASAADVTTSALLPRPVAPEGGLSIRSIAAIWPMVNNQHVAEYFGVLQISDRDQRAAFVHEMRRHIRVIDVQPDHVALRLAEPALHRWHTSRLGLRVHVGRREVTTALLGREEATLQVDVSSLEPGVCRLVADIGGAARLETDNLASVMVSVYLVDVEGEPGDDESPAAAPGHVEDVLLYHQPWFPEGGMATPQRGVRGTVERLADGVLRGWAYDAEHDTFDVAVCIYLEGRLARFTWPTQRRTDLDRLRNAGSGARGRGFAVDLPLGYFQGDDEDRDVQVEAVVAGRNLVLRRSPLVVPPGVRDARWIEETRTWHLGPDLPEAPPAQAATNGSAPDADVLDPWWKVWT